VVADVLDELRRRPVDLPSLSGGRYDPPMCSNYLPVTAADRLMTFFGVEYAKEELLQREVFPLGIAPFIRLTAEGQEGGKPAPLLRAPQVAREPKASDELLPPKPAKPVKAPPPPSPQGDLF
jgi:hypothetical protein